MLNPRRFEFSLLRAGIVFGLPLVGYELAFAVLGSADRFLVRHYLGANALGLYSVASGLAQQANDLLVGPMILAILPIYMNIWSTFGKWKTTAFLNLALDLFLMGGAAVLAVSVVAAGDIVLLLASAKYSGADRFVPLLLAGFLIYATYVFFAAGLFIEKKTTKMAGILAAAAAANIALNCLLLPRMGLMGSAIATVLTYIFCVALLSRNSSGFLPVRVDLLSLAKYLVSALLAALISWHVEFGSALANILGKGCLCCSIYAAILSTMDQRLRRAAKWMAAEIRGLL